MSPPDAGGRKLARAFLEQTLASEGSALMLEHATREEVLRRLASAGRVPQAGAAATADGDASPAVAVTSPVAAVTRSAIVEAADLEALAALVASCTRCTLHESRKNPVFGEGAANARVVCVGEAPGKHEDETGRPFVGRAGGLLDRLLMSIGLPRTSVYICNVLKSRPPRNRDPLPAEVAACAPYLLRQLALIEPEVIIAFGAFAARTLLETKSALGRLRGTVHRYSGYPVVATYHPAALLRNPGWIRPTWEDLQIVRRMLDGVGNHEARSG
ncbi:uracil-DNA glycosylase [Candidatus Palauibacter sp.]|uniref:uracil-DNA glycosylase n=1 Tax=Candidatus Palauibacter sp. TaxID=3101350 RepID=UPI003B5C071C